jgi:LemA protein
MPAAPPGGDMVTVMVVAVLAVLGAALVAYAVGVYNGLIEVKNNIAKSWKNIDVLLQQRHDELPKLVGATKGYLRHESDLLERITRLRGAYDGATSIDEKTRAENELNRALGRLRLTLEGYPDLKSSPLFGQVLSRVSALESSVADRRELFNESVNVYNTRLESFPDLVIAGLLRYRPHAFLEVAPEQKADVAASF